MMDPKPALLRLPTTTLIGLYECLKGGVCFRCGLLLNDNPDVILYKQRDYKPIVKLIVDLLAAMGHSGSSFKMETVLDLTSKSDPLGRVSYSGRLVSDEFKTDCPMCLGANEFISEDHFIKEVTQRVFDEKHEIRNFKIQYYISPLIMIRKFYWYNIISADSERRHKRSILPELNVKGHVDYKEVFKWATSYLFKESLGVNPHMQGKFKIDVKFPNRQKEEDILKELSQFEVMNGPPKNKKSNKWKKESFRPEQQNSILPLSKIVKIFESNPISLISGKVAELREADSLLPFLQVDCSHENIFIAGNY